MVQNDFKTIINDAGDLITIESSESSKQVRYNGVSYSRLYSKSIYTGSYWDYLSVIPAAVQNPNILMIGLAGGTIAYQISRLLSHYNLDVVEIDRRMEEVARQVLPGGVRFNLIIQNGLEYVKHSAGKYDFILSDAFINSKIAKGFTDEPFVADSCNALKANGVFAINCITSITEILRTRALIRALKSHYKKVYRINISFWGNNTILLGSKSMDRQQIFRGISSGIPIDRENAKVIDAIYGMKEL